MDGEIKQRSKIAIIGAGNVGASIAYVMSIKRTCDELVLIDVIREKAEGEVMDIVHGLPFLNTMTIRTGDFSDVADCGIIVFSAGAGRKPGETRLDLAAKNCRIAKSATLEMMKYYNGGVILVVANPVDVLTYQIAKWSGLPRHLVVGSGTVLDGIRLRTLLAHKFNIDMKNIHAYIIGEHGEAQFPAWSFSKIAGCTIEEFCKISGNNLSEEEKEQFAKDTRTAGAEIIKRKGATFYGIAIAVNELCASLLHDKNTIRTVGAVLDGEYGLKDVVLNVPCVVGRNGIEKILEIDLTEDENQKLLKASDSVKSVLVGTNDI